jgi:uncharacterized protein DUF4440
VGVQDEIVLTTRDEFQDTGASTGDDRASIHASGNALDAGNRTRREVGHHGIPVESATGGDGRQIDKTEFLSLNAGSPGVTDVAFDEIDIRVLGDVALVHAVRHYRRDDVPGSRRYTDVWVLEADRWLAVAAQITPVA